MAKKPHQDSQNMKTLLQPEYHPMSAEEAEKFRKQPGGKRTGSQSSSSSLSSSSSTSKSSSNEKPRQEEKDLEDQDTEMEHSGLQGASEKSSSGSQPSSMSRVPFNRPENQKMTTDPGSGGGWNQTGSSSSLYPALPNQTTYNAKEMWEGKDWQDQKMKTQHGRGGGLNQDWTSSSVDPPLSPQSPGSARQGYEDLGNQMMMTYPGSGGGFNQTSSSSSLRPLSTNHSTGNAGQGYERKDLGNQMMKTQHGSGDGFNQDWTSSSVDPPSSPQSPGNARQNREGKGPGNQMMKTDLDYQKMKTQHGSGGGLGHSSSSDFRTPSPSPQSTWYGSEGQGGKVLGRPETKTQFASKDGSGADGSSDFRTSSPSPQSTWYESEGQGGKVPGRERDGSGPDRSYYAPPSSPPFQRSGSEGWAATNRNETDEEWRMEGGASSCCAVTELKRIHQCKDDLGPLKPGKRHAVMVDVRLSSTLYWLVFYNIPLTCFYWILPSSVTFLMKTVESSPNMSKCDAFNEKRRIVPFPGKHVWLPNFVKLPCAQNTSPGGFNQDSRWKQIKKQLNLLASKSTAGVRDVAETILSFNPKYKGQWSFESLSKFTQSLPKEDNYVHALFPKIAALAMRLPEEVQKPIPLLRAGHVAAITLSQAQIACLLANAFFCTFPHRNTSGPNAEYHNYPSINFSSLFGNRLERKNEKLRAIMHYFKVVTDRTTDLSGLVTFERRLLRGGDQPDWRSCTEEINKLYISSEGYIEKEGSGLLQVDFANSLIGGGVLGCGLVQEEILFIINPELIVSRLFTERLQDDECLIITGSQQFSSYDGYGDGFVWLGPHEEKLRRDGWKRLQRQIVALDALHYRGLKEQFRMDKIKRELNKAYCGFKGRHDNPDIATGKWGCGAFNGDPELKAVIQLMAAAKAGRGLAFFTFNNQHLERDLQRMHHLLVTRGITVGRLYGLLQDFCSQLPQVGLFQFLHSTITSDKTHKGHQSYL